MADSMFAREVAQKLERQGNAFITCRSLSVRARDINMQRKSRDADLEIVPAEPNSSATAMIDLTEGRITFDAQGAHEQVQLAQEQEKKNR
jgi:hypothetical protein